jgi:hypothetical protein
MLPLWQPQVRLCSSGLGRMPRLIRNDSDTHRHERIHAGTLPTLTPTDFLTQSERELKRTHGQKHGARYTNKLQ